MEHTLKHLSKEDVHRIAAAEENIGAASLTLTADDLRKIEMAVSKVRMEGARYPETAEKMTGL